MWGKFQDYLEKLKKDHKIRKRFLGGFLLLSVFVVAGVVWGFTQNGITLESDNVTTYCGYDEHTHTSECYTWVALTDDEAEDESDDMEEDTDDESASTDDISESADNADDADTDDDADVSDESDSDDDTNPADNSDDDEDADDDTDEDDPQEEDTYTDEDGVTYVYTLTCGYEEHTHTDTCYVDSSEDNDTDEEDEDEENIGVDASLYASSITTYAVSAASDESDNSDSTDYYFADQVTLTNAAQALDDDYIIYTIISGNYYVVSADDNSLVSCTYLGTITDTSSDDFISKTADGGGVLLA